MDMPERRLDGRDEEIVLPGQRIVDAHFHLFVRPTIRYLFDDYLADAGSGHDIVASVYVETQAFSRRDGPAIARPLGEVEFANGIGAMAASGVFGERRIAAAIVAHAALSQGDAIAEMLDAAQALAPQRLRGVRELLLDHDRDAAFRGAPHRPPQGLMNDPRFRAGFAHLAPRGLSFDAAVFDPQLPDLGRLADDFPDTTIILNHMGIAMAIDLDAAGRHAVFARWRARLKDVARRDNIVCKLGGLGMPPWGLGLDAREGSNGSALLAEAWRPYVETAIEAFGPERCMMASNYPPDARSAGFVPLWNALKRIVQACSETERSALFERTASRVYRLR